MRKRAGGLYIQEKKLFLISEGGQDLYWTPGGGVEAGESYEEALERELGEELDAKLLTHSLYMAVDDAAQNERVQYYLMDIDLPATLPQGTKSYWYSAHDHASNQIPISTRIHAIIFPKLLEDGLVA